VSSSCHGSTEERRDVTDSLQASAGTGCKVLVSLRSPSVLSAASANTSEATDDLQDRIGRFARYVFSLASAIFVVGRGVAFAQSGHLALSDLGAPDRIAYEVALVVLIASWWRCRRARMSVPTLRRFDAALTIAISTCWGLLAWSPGPIYPVSATLPVTHTLIGRSVVVPSTLRRTLWISIVSTLPTVFVIATHHVFAPDTPFDEVRTSLAVSWCGVAAAVATVISRTLYGLRQEIREVRQLGQYTLQEKIGEGGMGVVYRASHAMLRRPAAIKLLSKERASEADLARFEREVQLTSRLTHPNTVSIFDYGRTSEGVFYYAMEYLDGMDLDRLIRADGPLEAPRAIRILAGACGALEEAHALGMVHRDIKPANIVLTERADEPDIVKVVDFGLVRSLERHQGGASEFNAAVIGTPLYLAPEAVTSPETVDGRADIYAVGAVAYFLLTGKPVFEAVTVVELCSKHLLEQPVPPSRRLGRAIATDLESLVLACLAKDREARPASATALRAALLECEDAARYDPMASRAWWNTRGGEIRASGNAAGRSASSPAPAVTVSRVGARDRVEDGRR
jgi:serine/threonine-protein kinase